MKDATKFGVKLSRYISHFQYKYSILQQRVNNILGLQVVARKNVTLVYKDGQLFVIFT